MRYPFILLLIIVGIGAVDDMAHRDKPAPPPAAPSFPSFRPVDPAPVVILRPEGADAVGFTF